MNQGIKITFVVRNVTDYFWGKLADMDDAAKLQYLTDTARKGSGLDHLVSMKIGAGQFRDAVEFNAMRRSPMTIAYTSEPRRGYRLLTFACQTAKEVAR